MYRAATEVRVQCNGVALRVQTVGRTMVGYLHSLRERRMRMCLRKYLYIWQDLGTQMETSTFATSSDDS